MRIAVISAVTLLFLLMISESLLSRQPEKIGAVLETGGSVWMIRGEDKSTLSKGTELVMGDFVETGKASKAVLSLGKPPAQICLNSSSLFHIAQKYDETLYVIDEGQARATVKGLTKKMAVFIGDSVILSNEAVFDMARMENNRYLLYVLEGKVWWAHQKFCIKKYMSRGEFLFWNDGGIPTITETLRREAQKMIEWYDSEKRNESAPAPDGASGKEK